MQQVAYVLFSDKGTKITTNAEEAKRHQADGGKVESNVLRRDFVTNERWCETPSGRVSILPGESSFTPNEKAEKAAPKPAKAPKAEPAKEPAQEPAAE